MERLNATNLITAISEALGMAARRLSIIVLFASVLPGFGASYRTQNFIVEAPTREIAQRFGQAAEHYRKEKALEWIGQEMPVWGQPCPLTVKVTMGNAGGETKFFFDNGYVLGQQMFIEGTLDRLLASVLPHEVTHTVFAYYFGSPVPRWADEGGAVLSEDNVEKDRHDKMVRNILNHRREMPLRRLFSLRDYPGDVMVLYAQGFSVADFLVARSNRPAFLRFVHQGMRGNWDQAVYSNYGFRSVEDLEQAWLAHLRNTRVPAPQPFAENSRGRLPDPTQLVARQGDSAVPVAQPKFRLQAPEPGPEGRSDFTVMPRTGAAYLPDYDPTVSSRRDFPTPMAPTGWQPISNAPPGSPVVRLGTPRFESAAPQNVGNTEPRFGAPRR